MPDDKTEEQALEPVERSSDNEDVDRLFVVVMLVALGIATLAIVLVVVVRLRS